MKVDISLPPVGILGLGHLGNLLGLEFSSVSGSWGTWHNKQPKKIILPTFQFDWDKKKSWYQIPETEVILVLTIPPIIESLEGEAKRLHLWCEWMQKNRSQLKRLIYISTTGVYPKRNGIWRENSKFESDTNSGKLRLITEDILSKCFNLNIIRPGGIYGNGRGIDVRLKSGKPIPVSSTPVHRIHVSDLVQIIIFLAKNPNSASCINAVDLEPKPSCEVAQWLVENREDFSQEMLSTSNVLSSKKNNSPERHISNQLLKDLGIALKYPTFREGMDIFDKNS